MCVTFWIALISLFACKVKNVSCKLNLQFHKVLENHIHNSAAPPSDAHIFRATANMVDTAVRPRPGFYTFLRSDQNAGGDGLSFYNQKKLDRSQKVQILQQRRSLAHVPGCKPAMHLYHKVLGAHQPQVEDADTQTPATALHQLQINKTDPPAPSIEQQTLTEPTAIITTRQQLEGNGEGEEIIYELVSIINANSLSNSQQKPRLWRRHSFPPNWPPPVVTNGNGSRYPGANRLASSGAPPTNRKEGDSSIVPELQVTLWTNYGRRQRPVVILLHTKLCCRGNKTLRGQIHRQSVLVVH